MNLTIKLCLFFLPWMHSVILAVAELQVFFKKYSEYLLYIFVKLWENVPIFKKNSYGKLCMTQSFQTSHNTARVLVTPLGFCNWADIFQGTAGQVWTVDLSVSIPTSYTLYQAVPDHHINKLNHSPFNKEFTNKRII